MPKILSRHGDGLNDVVEAVKNVAELPGIQKFNEVLAALGRLPTHELMLELGQALKVPWKEIADLSQSDGYISGDAAINLGDYFDCPLMKVQLEFLQRQYGKAGDLNDKPRYEPDEDFRDNCG